MMDSWDDIKTLRILEGDCIQRMRELPDSSIDAIITDPPYMISYMHNSSGNVSWDGEFDLQEWSNQCFRVLKSGGHIASFGAARTIHRIATALEGAGFEVRDMINWIFTSGFPKNNNISARIDKMQGLRGHAGKAFDIGNDSSFRPTIDPREYEPLEPISEEAKRWKGYGSCLKPAQEPCIICRKPLSESSIAAQVLKTGTGALNIDGSRFAYGDPCWPFGDDLTERAGGNPLGRYPANVYVCKKAQKAEREAGLEHLDPRRKTSKMNHRNGEKDRLDGSPTPVRANFHPTVKPLKLMRYLVKLFTPPEGVVLDPFLGSGTTAMAAVLEGHDCIGMEITPSYIPIIRGRVAWAKEQYKRENSQLKLF